MKQSPIEMKGYIAVLSHTYLYRHFYVFVVVLYLLSACSLSPTPADRQLTVTPGVDETYAVYAALIQQQWQDKHPVIRIETDSWHLDNAYQISSAFPELDNNLIQNYLARNQSPVQLQAKFPLTDPYELLDQAGYEALFDRDLETSWQRFHAHYPATKGLYRLSQVGFNQEHNQALLGYSIGHAPLGGAGYYVWLMKSQGTWSVVREFMAWIA